ncbi:APC family permease [Clostridium sp. UBA6640]|uniref:APC family permease n=1 Tax=Clostridium sp. UBA6640 TaxID=1946370 RepID=UPI0025B83016|nr:amino acid permease [Clostridium sp. UBA6640]
MTNNSNDLTQTKNSGFKKEIGLFGGVSILGGIMVGSGIFYLGSYVLMRTGMSLGLALLSWILGGLVSLLGGICYAELGASDPRSGGLTVYLSEAYSPMVGFLGGFNSWLIGGPGSIAALAIALPSALTIIMPLGEWTIKIIAIFLIIALTIVNYFGVKFGSKLQNLSMIAKLIPIGIIMILGLLFGKVSPDLSLVPRTADASFGSIISMVAFAVVASLWAYEGWTNLNTVAEEVKNPKKNLPLAIIISILSITALYTLFNYSIYKVIPIDEIESLISNNQYYLGTYAAEKLLGNTGSILVVIGMVVAMFGALNGCILAFPRMYYAMSEQGHFFESFKKLHPVHKVPYAPLIVQCVISVILVLLRNLNQLTSLVVFSGMMFNTLGVYAVMIYRKKRPNVERPYKVIGYPITVILTTVIFVGLMINTFIEDPQTSIIGLVVPAIGTLFYFYFDRKNKTAQENKILQENIRG